MNIGRAIGLALLLAAGCAETFGALTGDYSLVREKEKEEEDRLKAQVDKAGAECSDMNLLERACSGKIEKLRNVQVTEDACGHIVDCAVKAGDVAALKAICDRQREGRYTYSSRERACETSGEAGLQEFEKSAAGCANLPDLYDKWSGQIGGEQSMQLYMRAGVHAAKCGEWAFLFLRLAHRGTYGEKGEGTRMLMAADKEVADLEGSLIAWMGKQAKVFDIPSKDVQLDAFAADHVVTWLLSSGKTGRCEEYIPLAPKMTPYTLSAWIKYFSEVKCHKAADLVAERLADQDADRRRQACFVLGEIGNRKHIKKLELLATTDAAYRVDNFVKVYYVRDACQEAIGRIKLREE